ncbi:MAG: DNA-binding protein [Candidatus Omnitrophota bacterium]|nr:DNA-binding protein [Candidatus Omnitrophota bacterium]
MRRRNQKIRICLLSSVLCLLSSVCFAQTLSSTELINNAKQYDGKLITYSGEVIGDVMSRGEFAWVNINDGQNALGVWISSALAQEIKFTGNYKSRGDRLEIVGEFHHACPEHGGDLDIHGRLLRKIASGRMVKEKLNFDKASLSFILLGALFLIWILTLFKRK